MNNAPNVPLGFRLVFRWYKEGRNIPPASHWVVLDSAADNWERAARLTDELGTPDEIVMDRICRAPDEEQAYSDCDTSLFIRDIHAKGI